MKSINLMLMYLCLFFGSTGYAQKINTLESFCSQENKLWKVTIPASAQSAKKTKYYKTIYAILKTGIAILSVDGQTITCYDYNGQLKWQAPAIQINSSNGGLYSSINGEYLYLRYPIHEDACTSAVYSADGQLLWSATYDSPLSISPSGKYLISMYDALDGSMPLMVLDIVTGEKKWQMNQSSLSYWQCSVSKNDKLFCYNAGTVKLYDLETGRLLWEKTVMVGAFGEVSSSFAGNIFAYNVAFRKAHNTKRVISIFDENGEVIWDKVNATIPGKRNGGVVRGISEGGEFIRINDIGESSLYDIREDKKLWTMTHKDSPGLMIRFTKEAMIFHSRKKQGTRIITLNKNGSIKNDYTINEQINYRYEKQGDVFLHITEKPDKIIFSKFKLSL